MMRSKVKAPKDGASNDKKKLQKLFEEHLAFFIFIFSLFLIREMPER
jgi:hypothetical protein